MMTNAKIVIYGNPATKKNSSRIIKAGNYMRLIPSKKYVDYEKLARKYMPKIETINKPINLKCVYYRADKRRVDLVNLLEATCDVLVKYKVLEDDNYKIIKSHDGSRVLFDKENPRVEIFIEDFKNV